MAFLLQRYGYGITRQVGSHLQLTCRRGGAEHHLTVPAHPALRIGTLNTILRLAAGFLQTSKEQLARELFG
jgi:predicted RNA binding protein YcfA (HicA-like mRNA interferase family)